MRWRTCLSDRVSGETTRVSLSSAHEQANGASSAPSISPDGRYVAFVSAASNLVSGDGNGVADVFVADRVTGRTARVSESSSGSQANGASSEPSIALDGRYVAFRSDASDLVSGDSNGAADVFVADRVAGETTRVSEGVLAAQANGASASPAITPDGRFVAFSSAASNLVLGDSNGVADVFVADRGTNTGEGPVGGLGVFGQTTRVSLTASGGQSSGESSEPAISSNGRAVAFTSAADLTGGGDDNAQPDVYVRDRVAESTALASGAMNAASRSPAISADGSYVAFASDAPLASGDTNGVSDI